MIRLRRWFFAPAILAVGAFALPMLLHADLDGQGRSDGRPGMRRSFAGSAPIISLALRHRDELKLSQEQAANLEKTRTHYQEQIAPLRQQLQTLESEISTLMQETPADLIQVKAKIHDSEKLRSELRYQRIEALENGKSILTAQQRDQLKSLLASRQNRRHPKQAS